MKQKDSIFIKLLKNHTSIDKDFIDIFLKKFKIKGGHKFEVEDKKVAKYFNIKLSTLRKRLNNTFSKKKIYYENVDYIKVKTGNTSEIKYMINYECLENLAMNGDTEKANMARLYFIQLRKFIRENQHLIYQAMENKKRLHKYKGFESIYFFAIKKKSNIFKIGKTSDIIKRLNNYNVGRINEVDLQYLALVKNKGLIEDCMKKLLKKFQKVKNKEIYEVDPKLIKHIASKCYKRNVSAEENKELYEEIASLLGLYVYTRDNPDIKPYVIIGK